MSEKLAKLTIEEIAKRDESFNETKRIVTTDGHWVDVDVKLRPSKIEAMLVEINDKIKYSHENGLEFPALQMLYLQIIKHFSSLEIPDEYELQIVTAKILQDGGYMGFIISAFDPAEIDGITKVMEASTKLRQQMNARVQEEAAKLVQEGDKDATVQQHGGTTKVS